MKRYLRVEEEMDQDLPGADLSGARHDDDELDEW
jgi:hypothetical protein